jgi:hypothetical protein
MADVATIPAAEAPKDKQPVVKPEKPDEDKYKEDLAKAEKEHTAAQEKLVSDRISQRPVKTETSSRVSRIAFTGTCIASELCAMLTR